MTVIDELERCGMTRSWPRLRKYPGICLEVTSLERYHYTALHLDLMEQGKYMEHNATSGCYRHLTSFSLLSEQRFGLLISLSSRD
jgi:hypothetical protein